MSLQTIRPVSRNQEETVMKSSIKYALAAMLAGGAALATTAPAQAGVGISLQFGDGGGYGYYGQDYYGYNYGRPCSFYFRHDLPAPGRCYRDYYGYYGPGVYLFDGFVFSSRGSYGHWRNNDRFRHWRGHNWNVRANDRNWDSNTRHNDGARNGNDDRHNSDTWNGDRHDGARHNDDRRGDYRDGGNRDHHGQH
jgi:hypothetical protein